MRVQLTRLGVLAVTVMSSRATWLVLIIAYVVTLLVVLGPVLFAPIGADDAYWVLHVGPKTGGSYWEAFWGPVENAFSFTGQPRTTALATSERQVVAMLAMDVATLFAIPPAVVWALIKIVLVSFTFVAVAVFLRVWQYRDATGAVRGFSPSTIAFVVILLPAAFAIGAKAQMEFSLNGWMVYPTLAYGPIIVFLIAASVAMLLARALLRNFRVWIAPTIIGFVVLALVANISYELIALVVPVVVASVLLQPLPEAPTSWRRWRPRLTVALALGVPFTLVFLAIRWRISQLPCQLDGSCYGGTLVEVSLKTIAKNFLGALPGRNGAFVEEAALRIGSWLPVATSATIGLGVLLALLAALLWSVWRLRHPGTDAVELSDAARGPLTIIPVLALIGLGGTVITGISANAVIQVSGMVSYRSGVLIWTAVALSGVLLVRAFTLLHGRKRVLGDVALVGGLVVVVAAVGLYFPRNVSSAQLYRSHIKTQAMDAIQWQVALGDRTRGADARRCETIERMLESYGEYVPRVERIAINTYRAYEHYHGEHYCSTGFGLEDPNAESES